MLPYLFLSCLYPTCLLSFISVFTSGKLPRSHIWRFHSVWDFRSGILLFSVINFLQENAVVLSCLSFYFMSFVEVTLFISFTVLISSCPLKTELKRGFRWFSFLFFKDISILSLFVQCSNLGGFLLWWLECETEGCSLEGAICFLFVVLCLFLGDSLLHCGAFMLVRFSPLGVECVLCFFLVCLVS